MELADLKLRFLTSGEQAAVGALRSVDSGIKQVESDAHKGGSALRGMLSTATGFALGGGILGLIGQVKSGIGGVINADAAMEQSRVILTQVTGSADKANELIASVQKTAAATPFSFSELITATQNLEGFGLNSQKWLTIIGDTAAGTGKSVDQVTQAVLDAQTGEYERLKELGIQASVTGDQVTFTYMKNGKMQTETVDRTNKDIINSTLQGIWNDKYAGMMEKQSHTFIGQWSTLKDNISMLMQSLSGGVFALVTKTLGYLNGMFTEFQNLVANGVSPLNAAIDTLGDAIAGVFGTRAARFFYGITDAIGQTVKFGQAMYAAFSSGWKVRDMVEVLPAPLEKVAHGFLVIADGIGDLIARWQSKGFDGMLRILPRELRQIAGGIGELAGQLAAGIGVVANIAIDTAVSIGGWLWEHKGDIWGGIKAFVGWTTNEFSDAASATLNVALKAGGQLLTWAGDLYGWIKAQLFGGTTAGESTTGADVAVGENTIPIGDVFLAVGKVALETGSTFAADAGAALVDAIANAADFAAPIASAVWDRITGVDWTKVVTADSFGAGSAFGTSVHDAIVAGVKAALGAIKDADISSDDIATVAEAIGKAMLAAPAALAGLTVSAGAFIAGAFKGLVFGDADLSAIGSNIWGQIKGAILGGTAQYDVASGTFGAPSGGLTDALTGIGQSIVDGLQNWSESLAQWLLDNGAAIISPIVDFFTGLPGKVKDAVPSINIDIPKPTMPDWLTDTKWLVDLIDGFIGLVQRLEFWKNRADAAQGAPPYSASSQGGGAFGQYHTNPNMLPPGADPNSGYVPGNPPIPSQPQQFAPTVNTNQFDSAMLGLKSRLDAFVKADHTARLKADISDATAKFGNALRMGAAWLRSVFTARFALDISGVYGGYYQASLVGAAWEGQTFSGRLTLDTSAATAAAVAAAQFIDSLLPHSPAKRGPLSRLPNWDALYAGIGPAGTRAGGIVAGHAAMIAGAFGARASSRALAGAGIGQTVVYDLRGAAIFDDPDKWINAKIDRRAGKIVDQRIGSRSLGESR